MPGRPILIVTALVVAACAIVFGIVSHGRLGDLATAVGALAAVAGVGLTAWAVVRSERRPTGPTRIEVAETGSVRAQGGATSVTGAVIADGNPPAEVHVRKTGSVDNGDGVTGYRQG